VEEESRNTVDVVGVRNLEARRPRRWTRRNPDTIKRMIKYNFCSV
jgi:hypothetical protein